MFMFLTLLLVSFAVTAVIGVMVAGPVPHVEERPALPAEHPLTAEPPRFFASDAELPPTKAPIPMEVLLAHIERHVRLEQAAAQTFLSLPSSDSLHSRTESPLVN